MNKMITVLLIIVGIIHLLPLSGVLGNEKLTHLYGIAFNENNLEILMRHRAVLFGLLGTFFIYAAFKPTLQPMAFIAGFVSVISFLVLAWSVGDYNASIQKVFIADLVALICLLLANVMYVINGNKD